MVWCNDNTNVVDNDIRRFTSYDTSRYKYKNQFTLETQVHNARTKKLSTTSGWREWWCVIKNAPNKYETKTRTTRAIPEAEPELNCALTCRSRNFCVCNLFRFVSLKIAKVVWCLVCGNRREQQNIHGSKIHTHLRNIFMITMSKIMWIHYL